MDIQVNSVKESDKSVLRNLMELYLYDFSEFIDMKVNAHGLFEYPYLDSYWTEKSYHPFFIHAGDDLVGFVLVRQESGEKEPTYSMEEFFILKRYRSKGAGRAAAREIFTRFPGWWRVGEIPENKPAMEFWRKVIGEFTAGSYKETSQTPWGGPLQTFDSRLARKG